MIGSLVYYNCVGSKSLGIVTDMFRYEAPGGRAFGALASNSLVISVEWLKKEGPLPQAVSPSTHPLGSHGFSVTGSESYWPIDWYKKKWYRADLFKVISNGK